MLDLLSFVILKSNANIKADFAIIIKSTSTKYYFGKFTKEGTCLEQKLYCKQEIDELALNVDNIFSYNFEEEFNGNKTKKIILMPGNFISFVDYKKERKEYTKLDNLKPIYLALSQAEEELIKKEKSL